MKRIKARLTILSIFSAFILQACYCTSTIPDVACVAEDGSIYYEQDDLWGKDYCRNGDPLYTPGAPSALPTPNNSTTFIAPATTLNCNFLALTSPLDGLPNGMATFYWNPLPNATGYRINVYDSGGALLASFNAEGANTNLLADISSGAIGGQFELRIELVAIGANGASCSRSVNLLRAASGGGGGASGGGAPGAVATPTCSEDPRPECIK